jgi:hypothetical protein
MDRRIVTPAYLVERGTVQEIVTVRDVAVTKSMDTRGGKAVAPADTSRVVEPDATLLLAGTTTSAKKMLEATMAFVAEPITAD